jgi:hypothetical protein
MGGQADGAVFAQARGRHVMERNGGTKKERVEQRATDA